MKITYRQALKSLPLFTKQTLIKLYKERNKTQTGREYARGVFLSSALDHISKSSK